MTATADRHVEIERRPGWKVQAAAGLGVAALGLAALASWPDAPGSGARTARAGVEPDPVVLPTPVAADTATGPATEPDPDWLVWTDETAGFTLHYPERWRMIDPFSTDSGPTGAVPLALLATRDVAVHNGRCGDAAGADGLGPTDALVAIYEIGGARFGPYTGLNSFRPQVLDACPHLAPLWEFTRFGLGGRAFVAFVPIGRHAADDLRREARGIIESLSVDPEPIPCAHRFGPGHLSLRSADRPGPRLALVVDDTLLSWRGGSCAVSTVDIAPPARPLTTHVAAVDGQLVVSPGLGGSAVAIPADGSGRAHEVGDADTLVADAGRVWLVRGDVAVAYPDGEEQAAAAVPLHAAPPPDLVFDGDDITGIRWAGSTVAVALGRGLRFPPDLWSTLAADPDRHELYLAVEVSRAERRILRVPTDGSRATVVATMSQSLGDRPGLVVVPD